ncbi:SMI1/KNR4 family protein [Kitasatospora saccharophila]|uniref:SMI1/KNR4 family protein n=1 Tax=Kitasatospora saccharophila TaxID=407973 RepID=UPI00363FBC5E
MTVERPEELERLERDLRAVVARLARSAPEGWTELRLEAVDSRDGPGTHGEWTLADGSRHGLQAEPANLDALAATIAAERGWPRARLHLEHAPAGPYTLTATPEPPATRGRLLVLDPGYVHPAPGRDQPGSVLPPAGDPARAVALLVEYRRRVAELTGYERPLDPPLTPGQIEEAERRLGHRLPDDLRALYRVANGCDVMADGLWLGSLRWLPLDEAVRAHANWARHPHRPDLDQPTDVRVMAEPGPPDTVRRCLNHPGWIPFATADDGNYHAVDLAPAEHGRPGQVIESGRDFHDGPLYVADSVTSLLAAWIDLLDRGAYEIEDAPEDGEEIDPAHPPYLDFTESVRPPRIESSALGPDLPAVVAPTLRRVTVNGEAGAGPSTSRRWPPRPACGCSGSATAPSPVWRCCVRCRWSSCGSGWTVRGWRRWPGIRGWGRSIWPAGCRWTWRRCGRCPRCGGWTCRVVRWCGTWAYCGSWRVCGTWR